MHADDATLVRHRFLQTCDRDAGGIAGEDGCFGYELFKLAENLAL
jgi:hypothetical protein